MKEVDELNEKVSLLGQMVKPLLRYSPPKIGDRGNSLMPFNKDREWINAVIGSRPAINLKAQRFGKIKGFEKLALHVFGKPEKWVSRVVFKAHLKQSTWLLQSMQTCYPLTWDEPAEFVDTVDKVILLLKKVVDILTKVYSNLNGDNNTSPETEVDYPLAYDNEISTGLLEELIKIDALTCAVYSLDYVDIDKPEETLAAGKGKLGETGRKKSPYQTPAGFHLKDWVIEGYWPLLESWLIKEWSIDNEKICIENLHLNSSFTPKAAISLLIKLKKAGKAFRSSKIGSYTAEQAVEIIKETFGLDCNVETYRSYHRNKKSYKLLPTIIPAMPVVKPKP